MIRSFARPAAALLLGALCLTAAGCGGDALSGSSYADGDGSVSIDFKSGGKADVTMLNVKTEATYTIEGDKVTITSAAEKGTSMVLTIKSDGTLDGGIMFGTLKKK